MTERNLGENPGNLTPQQLNQELGRLLRLIPVTTGDGFLRAMAKVEFTPAGVKAANLDRIVAIFIDEVNRNNQRRTRSELLLVNKERLRTILQSSCLTTHAIDYIIELYSWQFVWGRLEETASKLFLLCDPGDPTSGGIFQPERALVLERQLLFHLIDDYRRKEFIQESRESSPRDRDGNVLFNKETIALGKENMRKMREKIDQWRTTYQEKYGVTIYQL